MDKRGNVDVDKREESSGSKFGECSSRNEKIVFRYLHKQKAQKMKRSVKRNESYYALCKAEGQRKSLIEVTTENCLEC